MLLLLSYHTQKDSGGEAPSSGLRTQAENLPRYCTSIYVYSGQND
jgi:hypothetical protein